MSSMWMIIMPHILLSVGALLVFILGAFWSKRPVYTLFLISLASSGFAGLWPLFFAPSYPVAMIDVSFYGRYFVILISLLTFIVVLFTGTYARRRGFERDELYALILLSALGMMLVSGALNWVLLFVGLELFSICIYVIIALREGHELSGEAAVKYFIMGSVASSFLLFGIALVYAGSGEVGIASSLSYTGAMNTAVAGLAFVLVGLGFKASLVPFHLWTPDVYQGAPAPVTAFLSTGSKVAVFAAILRMALEGAQGTWSSLSPVIWVLAALTMTAGNLGALTQTGMKRMLAYSSVAHMGYMLMALNAVSVSGPGAIMFYTAVYALMDLGAFGSLGLLSPLKDDLDDMQDFRGLGYARYWTAGVFALSLITLAGLPPTAGFFGKFFLFQATLQAGYPFLALIGIITAILSIYYYLKPLTVMYMTAPQESEDLLSTPASGRVALGLVLTGILFLGLAPAPLFNLLAALTP